MSRPMDCRPLWNVAIVWFVERGSVAPVANSSVPFKWSPIVMSKPKRARMRSRQRSAASSTLAVAPEPTTRS